MLVQNRVAAAEPRLPDEVRRSGVTVRKNSPDLLVVVHLVSPDKTYDQVYISNYALLNVRDVLARIEGVGAVNLFGAREYSMRIWLDPERIAGLGMTAEEVIAALADAERAGRRRRHRRAADQNRQRVPADAATQGPAEGAGRVRGHHRQDRRRRPRRASEGRRRGSSSARSTTTPTAIRTVTRRRWWF